MSLGFLNSTAPYSHRITSHRFASSLRTAPPPFLAAPFLATLVSCSSIYCSPAPFPRPCPSLVKKSTPGPKLSFRIPPPFQAGEESAVYSTCRAINSGSLGRGAASWSFSNGAVLASDLVNQPQPPAQTCHSDRSKPTLFLLLRSREGSACVARYSSPSHVSSDESLFDSTTR